MAAESGLIRLDTSNLRGDLYGGLTAAVVALPLALGFGVASGAGPVAGLYGAICVGFFAALFGGTPAQVSGPTGPMTVVSAAVFTKFAGEPALAFTCVMLAGALQMLFGWLRLGRYINLVPYPVVSGFMSGIGVIIILLQLAPIAGYPGEGNVVNALTALPGRFERPVWDAVIAGLVSLAICFLTPVRVSRIVPATLVALVAGTLLVSFWLTEAPVIGRIPTALPDWQLPAFDAARFVDLAVSAFVLAMLGSIDSLLTSLIADNATRTWHDSERELVGQGLGNLVAGLAGGIPGAGATIRTLVNIRSGGRTHLSGAVHALVLLAVVLGLGGLAGRVPHAVLAGILIKVGIDVIDWPSLARVPRMPRSATLLMLVVLALTVLVDVITAVIAGTVLASLVLAKEMADLQLESMRTVGDLAEGEALLDADEAAAMRRCRGRALLVHLSGPMSFGAANGMTRRMATAVRYDVVIVDLTHVPSIDVSAAMALDTLARNAAAERRTVLLCGMAKPVAALLGRLGVADDLEELDRFRTRLQALERAAALLEASAPKP